MSALRAIARRILLSNGAVISRPPGQFSLADFKLQRARERGLRVDMAVDAGAGVGEWTKSLKRLYPNAQVLCIEPRPEAQAMLTRLKERLPGLSVVSTAVGDVSRSDVPFYEHGDQSSTLRTSSGQPFGRVTKVRMKTLDGLIEKLSLPMPDLIKLDLQGAEILALRGAARCLQHAEAVIAEVSFIAFQDSNPMMADVVTFMKEHGFRTYDILTLSHRPLDGALAQADVLFVRDKSPLVADRRWASAAEWT